MEDRKVNLTEIDNQKNGFLTLEFMISLMVCLGLCSMLASYHRASIAWQHEALQRWRAIQYVEEMVDRIRQDPRQYKPGRYEYPAGITLVVGQQKTIPLLNGACSMYVQHGTMSARWQSVDHKERVLQVSLLIL